MGLFLRNHIIHSCGISSGSLSLSGGSVTRTVLVPGVTDVEFVYGWTNFSTVILVLIFSFFLGTTNSFESDLDNSIVN